MTNNHPDYKFFQSINILIFAITKPNHFLIKQILIGRLDGGYTLRNIDATGYALKTNLPSNTAFRGYGGPEGAIVIETVMDHIAHILKMDPAEGI